MNDPQTIIVTDPVTYSLLNSGLLFPIMVAAFAAIIAVIATAQIWNKFFPRRNGQYACFIVGAVAAYLVLQHMMVF